MIRAPSLTSAATFLLVLAGCIGLGLGGCSDGGGENGGPSCLEGVYSCFDPTGDCLLETSAGQVTITFDSGATVVGPVGLASFAANNSAGQLCFNRSKDGTTIVIEANGGTYRVTRSGSGATSVVCPDGTTQEHEAGEFPSTATGIDPGILIGCRVAGICWQNSDCETGQVCCGGECHAGERCPGTCGIDDHCGQGNRCCDGWCTSLPTCRRPCAVDFQCDDGVYCNGGEVCVLGFCAPGPDLACDDTVACTQDRCDEALQFCEHTPDDDLCGTNQRCSPAAGCEDIIPCTVDPDCDDQDACTTDTCVDDICEFAAVQGCCNLDADCADGDFCNGQEVCQNHTCAAGSLPDCDDQVACTTDTCDTQRGGCTPIPDASHCGPDQMCDPAEGCIDTADCIVDQYEPNDISTQQATVLPAEMVIAVLCPGEQDWYVFDMTSSVSMVPMLVAVYDASTGGIEMHVEGGEGGELGELLPDMPEGILMYELLAWTGGDVTVWVEGKTADAWSNYLMIMDPEE